MELGWLTARPVAHRGLHDSGRGIIENTPSAIEAAIAAGYAIEVDVQRTGDGRAVVFHDDTLDRLTTARGAVAARSLDELRHVRLRGTTDRIKDLEALLDQVAGRTALFVELKSLWDGDTTLVRCLARAVAGYRGQLAAMSFDPVLVAALRRTVPTLPRGIVACRFDTAAERRRVTALRRLVLRHVLHAPMTRPHFIAYDVNGLPAPATRVFRLSGRPVLAWTIRSQADALHARRYADQIIFEGMRP